MKPHLVVVGSSNTDLVLACHLIGNPSPGAAVAVLFVEHRDHYAASAAAAAADVARAHAPRRVLGELLA